MTPAKRLTWLLVAPCIALFLGACGSDESNQRQPSPDTTPPTLNLSSVTPAVAKHGQTVTVTVLSADSEATAEVSIIDSALELTAGETLEDGTLSFTFVVDDSLADGDHTVSAILTDDAGNASEALSVGSFTVDSIPPSISGLSLGTNVSVKEGGSAFVTLVSSEPLTDETTVSVEDGGAMQKVQAPSALPTYTYTVTGDEAEGLTQIMIVAYDAAGNMGELGPFDGFYIDYTSPGIIGEITAPSSSVSLEADDSFEFVFEADEELASVTAKFSLGETDINLLIEEPEAPDLNYTAYRPLNLCNLCAVGVWSASATLTDAAGNASTIELGTVELVE